MKKIFLFVILLIFTTGCQLGPKYIPPSPPTPVEWKNPHIEVNGLPDFCNWWEVFQDETLNQLEEEAVANNPNLYVALARVDEALATAGVSRADLFPQLNFNPTYDYYHIRSHSTFSKHITKQSPFISNLAGNNLFRPSVYTLPLLLSYEVDLWGQYRSAYEAAFRNFEAQEEAYRVTLLTLTTDLASAYFNARILDTTIEYLASVVKTYSENLKLSESRYQKGLINYTYVNNDLVSLKNAESQYYDAIRSRGIQEDLIASLIGVPASEFHLEPSPLLDPPPVIPAGIPSTILLRRPDIAQAERTMASQNASIGSAYASFFPSLNLTGALGFLGVDLPDFLRLNARYWDFGALGNQTIFDGLRKYENYQASWARFREADNNYKQVVLTAFREVEDSLNNLDWFAKEYDSLAVSFKAAGATTKLARHRFGQGLTNYIEVVDDERTELNTGLNFYNILGMRYQSTIQLIKALGGGW